MFDDYFGNVEKTLIGIKTLSWVWFMRKVNRNHALVYA